MIEKNKIQKTKKGFSPLAALIGAIISILSMYIISTTIFSSQEIVTSSVQDKACSTFISSQNTNLGQLVVYLTNLELKCKKEQFTIDTKSKQETFDKVSDSMIKCWERYNKGESDFLGRFGTDGNWCFVCSKINFEQKDNSYSYSNDFIPYLLNKNLRLTNGTKTTYGDYINLQYYNGDEKKLEDIQKGIKEINNLNEKGDPTLNSLISSMSQKNEELFSLSQKRIDTNEEIFVVYRYNQIPKETLEIAIDIGASVGTGIAISYAIESIIIWGAGAVVTVATGGIAGPAALAVAGSASTYKATKKAKAIEKLNNAYKKASEVMDLSKDAMKFSKGKKLFNIANKFDGSINSAFKVGTQLKKIDSKLGSEYISLANTLKQIGINNVNELSQTIISKQDNFLKLQKQTLKAIDDGLINNKGISKVANIQTSQLDEINLLKNKLKEFENFDEFSKLSQTQKDSFISQTLKATKLFFGIGAGAIAGVTTANYNDVNVQYVDIMNKEQYYRMCGTEPIYSK